MQTLLTPIRTPEKKVKTTTVGKLPKIDLRSLLRRIPFGPREAKLAVVLIFTLCWLSIALVRSNVARDPGARDASSLLGLATALQQGAISGRDFQSVYGPAAQFLAWIATLATTTRTALDAYGMITFVFCAATALLAAAMLLICDRISWQQCAIFYAFSFFLNLFFGVLDIRTLLLLLNAAFAYRTIAAETVLRQTAWATACGLLCLVSQLVTFELGICAAITVVCALIAGSVLTRHGEVLLGAEVFVATYTVANLGLVIVFRLTSSSYGLLFDYHNYALEILRGLHNSMGTLWALSLAKTVVLLIVSLYVIGMCVAAAWRFDPLEASLLASFAFAAVMWLKTALVRSDISQIAVAFTPMIVILSLLSTIEWTSVKRRIAWLAGCAAILVWPSLNLSAPLDLWKLMRGEPSAKASIRAIYATPKPLDASLKANLGTPDLADRRDVSILAFPYDNYISVGLRRPFFAPVLESYAASTEALEQYYVRALDRQRRAGLEIVYGLDKDLVPTVDGIQAITRSPIVFEYVYKHFEIVSNEQHTDAHYILRPRRQPRDTAMEELRFSIPRQVVDSGILKLNVPSACGLVQLETRIEYAKNPRIFRPSGIELSLSNSDRAVWQGAVRPLKPSETFVTYISPLPPQTFHKVFGEGPVQNMKWDKLEYHAFRADFLGSPATRIDVTAIRCVDPEKFVEATVPLGAGS
ncbi:MAG: hypothetical protein DMG16_00820 [Acidobacteria bacterium]|nr:MAG: hypothetical protein DMG16_00820 [Acidobacteriota bacterium]